jgi:hypothetical protein
MMRRVIITAALTLLALRAAIIALATPQVSTRTPPAMSTALFLCHAQQSIDQNCAAALANALVIEQSQRDATTTADRSCHTSPRTFPKRPGARP